MRQDIALGTGLSPTVPLRALLLQMGSCSFDTKAPPDMFTQLQKLEFSIISLMVLQSISRLWLRSLGLPKSRVWSLLAYIHLS